MRAAQLDVAQIYGGELPDGPRVWRAFRWAGSRPARARRAGAEAILLDGPANGITFDWTRPARLPEK